MKIFPQVVSPLLPPIQPQSPPPPPLRVNRREFLEEVKAGTQLRPVTPPMERTPTEEKITDVASELKQRVLKLRKKEVCTL